MGDYRQSAFDTPYGHAMACPYRKETDMEDSNANQATSPSPITNCPSPTARRSGGPRTAEGKRRSCRNARRHGLYTDERFLRGATDKLSKPRRGDLT